MQAEIKVLGGLPVTVEFEVHGVERFIDWRIIAVNGNEMRSAAWLRKRIQKTRGEENRIYDTLAAILEQHDAYEIRGLCCE